MRKTYTKTFDWSAEEFLAGASDPSHNCSDTNETETGFPAPPDPESSPESEQDETLGIEAARQVLMKEIKF